jgi:hypothetical protein
MNRITAVPVLLVVLGLHVAQAADIRRISLEGKEGVPLRPARARHGYLSSHAFVLFSFTMNSTASHWGHWMKTTNW